MKKKTILSIIMLMMSVMSFANGEQDLIGEQLDLQVGYYDKGQMTHPKPRTPEVIPVIYFNDNRLYFATPCDGYTLQIVDAAENICYELVIPMGTQQITLPGYLAGEYELRIIQGNTIYYGTIILNI